MDIEYIEEIEGASDFSIYKADDDKRLVFGWASIAMTVDGEPLEDLQKDVIDEDDLEEAAYQYVLNFRDTGEEHMPGLRKKGRLVESCVFTKEKQRAMGLAEGALPVGWWIGFYIDDDDTWKRIKNGTYKMFSIEGKAEREPVEKSVYDYLEEIEKFNPYHGSDGRFTSANSATSFTIRTRAGYNQGMADVAIAREKQRTAGDGSEFGLTKEQHQELERRLNSGSRFGFGTKAKEIGMSEEDQKKYKEKYYDKQKADKNRKERKKRNEEQKEKRLQELDARVKEEFPGLDSAIDRANHTSFFENGTSQAREALRRLDDYRERNQPQDDWTDEQKEYAKQREQQFKQLLTERYNDSMTRFADDPSWMVAGPANYNARSHEKKMQAARNSTDKYEEKLANFEENTKKKLRSMEPEEKQIARYRRGSSEPIASDDPLAEKKLQARIDGMKETQQQMKDANAYWRKHKTMEGFSGFDEESNKNIDASMKERIDDLNRRGFTDMANAQKPFTSYQLSNNNANIKANQSRLDNMKQHKQKQAEQAASGGGRKSFNGGTMVHNADLDRLQLVFDGKPSEEVRALLKRNGFRWSPKNKAWQRQDTPNAERAAKIVMEALSKSIKALKTETKMGFFGYEGNDSQRYEDIDIVMG